MRKTLLTVVLGIAVLLAACGPAARPSTTVNAAQAIAQFERELEALRQELQIPGLSAAIVQDQEVIWTKGFGYADLENQIEATPDTPYRLASVTKPIAATLIMQLVEEGALGLDDAVSKYGVRPESNGVVRVHHLLTHTSEGIPGTRHNYDGGRYALLGQVVEAATGQSFETLLSERVLEPLEMTNSAPSYPECALGALESPESSARERCHAQVNRALTKPYQLDPSYRVAEGGYQSGFSPAAGLIASVSDLAKFDIALDRNALIGKESQEAMFAPAYSTHEGREDLAYGLGWYSQEYMGTRLVWHAGRWPPSTSSLYLKVPDQNLTLILLANTTYLNTPYPMGEGDVLYCTPALAFYKAFVVPRRHGRTVPKVDWSADEETLVKQLRPIRSATLRRVLERELWSYRQVYTSQGKSAQASRLSRVHTRVYPRSPMSDLDSYAFQGVEYYAPVRAEAELSKAELARLAHTYRLIKPPDIDTADLPPKFDLQVRAGQLVGLAEEGCVSLVALTPTRFAIPENPDLILEFELDEDQVNSLMLRAGPLAVTYKPSGPSPD